MTRSVTRSMMAIGFLVLSLVAILPTQAAPVECCAISRGSGGASIATAEPSDSVFANPAAINQVKNSYILSSFFINQMTLGLFDNNRDSLFPAGLTFAQYKKEEDALFQKENTLSLTMGAVFKRRFQFGLTVKNEQYLQLDKRHANIAADAGVLFIPSAKFGIGITSYNFYNAPEKEIEDLVGAQSWGAGLNYYYGNFLKLKLDYRPVEDFRTEGSFVMAGLETQTVSFMAFRVGYSYLVKDGDTRTFPYDRKYSFGMGFLGPRFHINYAFEDEKPTNESLHTIDLGIPF